jgi:cytochrome c oxidase subunit 3
MTSTTIEPLGVAPAGAAGQAQVGAPRSNLRSGHEAASRSGIWVAVFAITMSFAAFTSAMFVRQGSGNDWSHIVMPPILYSNTFLLLLSSVALEIWRRSFRSAQSREEKSSRAGISWLLVTLVLGLLFVAGQYLAWQQLRAAGLFLSTTPNSSFYYVITAMHALHVTAGMAALSYLLVRLGFSPAKLRRSTVDSTRVYWHFMGILWVYLFVVMSTRL